MEVEYPNHGEISLAHFGVLFLDEFTEFPKNILELMRTPIEDKKITISRLNATLTYPSNCMLVVSMNPCPCGYYGSLEKQCSCNESQISKYLGKVSGPVLDRIDIQIEVPSIKYEKIDSNNEDIKYSSCEIKKRVKNARDIQLKRYKKYDIYTNSELTPKLIEKFCELDNKSKEILKIAFNKLGLSARAYNKIIKVARTIADLGKSTDIQVNHIAEAIQYRNLDKKFWNN